MYLTFSVWQNPTTKKRVAVKCETEYQMKGIMRDANYLDGVTNIRTCNGKPKCDQMLNGAEYYKYFLWYN